MPPEVDTDVQVTAGDTLSQTVGGGGGGQSAPQTVFTAEQVEKFRADERNKAQSKIDKLKADFEAQQAQFNQLAETVAQREAREAEEAEARTKALQAAEEADLDARTLLDRRTAEWEEKFAALKRENEQREKVLAMERKFLENKAYVQGRIAEETANKTIHPAFFDYIDGENPEQIEASIQLAKQKTELMVQEIAAREAGSTQRAFQTGQSVSTNTGPSTMGTVGEGGEEIDWDNYSYADHQKYRQNLIRSNGNSGIFG